MIIAARYNGPPGSGNGGYSSGLFASTVDAPAALVTLRRPPPLDTPLTVVRVDDRVDIRVRDRVIASAVPVEPPAEAVPPVPLAEARAASREFPGFADHPFPSCFVCGPRRPEDDGLRIFPGLLGDGRSAAVWRVPPDVDAVLTWAALDCPGGWAIVSAGRPYVLGGMAAHVTAVPVPGTECVVVGQVMRLDGRKVHVRSTVYAPDGAALALVEATWVGV